MVSHSGKAGVWLSFSTGHLGFRGSLPLMVQEFMSKSVSAEDTGSCSLELSHQVVIQISENKKKMYWLTINIFWEISKYDEVRFVNRPSQNPAQPVVVVDQNSLFGHTVGHHPDTQQEHEEEHVHHLHKKHTWKSRYKKALTQWQKYFCL